MANLVENRQEIEADLELRTFGECRIERKHRSSSSSSSGKGPERAKQSKKRIKRRLMMSQAGYWSEAANRRKTY